MPDRQSQLDWQQCIAQAQSLISGEPNLIANLANISALINDALDDLNWCGFYLVEGEELVLGPFQGKTACIRIAKGKGVCGTAMAEGKTQRVADVHAFSGHIACDAASESEIVVPIVVAGQVLAVFDIDSPKKNRFSEVEQNGLEQLVAEVLVPLFERAAAQ
ncbi:GAF domain-containing protein [Neiella marina]|uniref:GAF domain-containing protein n=1 Tax=Neiella holothuriorum TaxID=2870530 RepID=A0ABS7ED68_9GAMM|nr:GAF domain-containing protein [Neiella holothuriorum]MBW8190270.1 GAF domain-containing protein [Neiella holothuriorum]